ncbi:SMEK domain-containing protein [Pseudomonas sp. NPDC047961]
MISRGYLIGQIIDEFSAVSEQAKLRNQLGLTDLSVFSENFFREVINITKGYSLKNTNEDRSNEPGVDLCDGIARIAIQVTTSKTSEKVKKTLKNITPDQIQNFERFVVLVVGEKQGSYQAVAEALKDRSASGIPAELSFDTSADIWDLVDLARDAMGLEFSKLQSLHRLIQEQMAKVKIELQVPDELGNYPVSGYALWEARGVPRIGTGQKFAEWDLKLANINRLPTQEEVDEVCNSLKDFCSRLRKLPRITREFFAELHERAEPMNYRFSDNVSLFLPSITKTYPPGEVHVELSLLEAENLLQVSADEYYLNEKLPAEIGLRIGLSCESLRLGFYQFVIDNQLSFKKVIGEIDFSEF